MPAKKEIKLVEVKQDKTASKPIFKGNKTAPLRQTNNLRINL